MCGGGVVDMKVDCPCRLRGLAGDVAIAGEFANSCDN